MEPVEEIGSYDPEENMIDWDYFDLCRNIPVVEQPGRTVAALTVPSPFQYCLRKLFLSLEPEIGEPDMNFTARQKLNWINLYTVLIVAGIIALVMQSWPVFFLTTGALLLLAVRKAIHPDQKDAGTGKFRIILGMEPKSRYRPMN